MGMIMEEQETHVSFMRNSDMCTVYTTDSTMMTKLDKLANSEDAPYWKVKKEHRLPSGELVGKTYETHKKLISFRGNIVTREMTPEQKEAAALRMREWQERKRQEQAEKEVKA